MGASRSVRSVITILMNLLVVAAVFDTVRVVVTFFGTLASQTWGQAAIRVTDLVVIPFGVEAIKTPYGGAFDVDAALTVGALLLAEWSLSALRGRV